MLLKTLPVIKVHNDDNYVVLFVLFSLSLCLSTFLYLKFLVVWALVLLADFVLEFRFEYLWPFWLFIRSVYDSFRYQGLVSDSPDHMKSPDFISTSLNTPRVRWFNVASWWLGRKASSYTDCQTSFLSGFLSVLCVCGVYIRHHMPALHPRAVAVLRCQHVRVGAVCLAHR